jgi:hypothetical protein
MIIMGIDPGNFKSGVTIWSRAGKENKYQIDYNNILINEDVLKLIQNNEGLIDVLACEWIQAMGMAVGKEVFETCLWAGRFVERASSCGISCRCVPRGVIKLHHCGTPHAKDSNICQALRDKYGEKGTKKDPGFFYGVKDHIWQACAVAAYAAEGGKDPKELHYPFVIED